MLKRCLIIFAKEPQKGKVKTRLKNYLSEAQRLNLYKAFLKDTLNLTNNLRCKNKILAYEAGIKSPRYLKKITGQFKLYKQKGRDLGQKMHNAFKFAKANNMSEIVIIGSDSPNLPASFIENAFRKLNKNDLVLGPTIDGGYYLIGVKIPCFGLFKGIKWSSQEVLRDTLKNSRELNKKVALLDSWYDIDRTASLARLRRDLKREKDRSIAKWTRRLLKI